MTFTECVGKVRGQSVKHGTVDWDPATSLQTTLADGEVRDEPGVYVLSALRDDDATVVYVGRAGTLRNDGTFKDQKLLGRLHAKQDGMSREVFFKQKLGEGGFTALRIEWFQTWDERAHRVPALEEAELIQAYFNDRGCLPPWNASF